MKLPYSWLREQVEVSAPATEIARVLSVRGFAVEGLDQTPDGDTVLDVEVTANRPDCMSIRGLAREVATAFGLALRPEAAADDLAPAQGHEVPIDIERPDLCGRYAGALATVTVGPSPSWMQDRLRACGVRPISNIVDITNYVLLELGQPMHAFDVRTLRGPAIRVRAAHAGETIRTLDGQDRRLTPDMLVIADGERAAAIAGVMGGAASEVTTGTTRMLFESAHFNALSVRRTSKALGLKTEASMRFERGTDPALPARAMARACALLRQIGAGLPDGSILDCHPAPVASRVLPLRRTRLAQLLGVAIPDAEVTRILESLAFVPRAAHDGWLVDIPSARVDILREVDIVEEVARHHGFDKIPASFPVLRAAPPPTDPRVTLARHLRTVMVGAGFFEAMTFGFIAESTASPFSAPDDLVTIANPLSETFAVLRPSLVPGLLGSLGHNLRREQTDVRLFEIGARFARGYGERRALAFAFAGAADTPHWSTPAPPASFFDAKAVVERAGLALGGALRIATHQVAWLVPGQSAAVYLGDASIGLLGRVTPAILEQHGIEPTTSVFVAELDLDAATEGGRATRRVEPLPRYPSVARDIALLVDDTLVADALRATIRAAAPATLVQVREFDRYQGKGIPEGKVSLALRLTFRAADRTLTDAEVQSAMEAVVGAVRRDHGAQQR